MSETTLTPQVSGNGANVSKISEAVIRFAGNSQDGIQAIGGFLARLAGRSEQEVMTFMTIPSTISGGPSIFQVRIGSGEVLSAGDEADVLMAFYQHSYESHIGSLKKGGIVIYDQDHVQPKPEWEADYRHVAVPITSRTVEAIGGTAKDKGKNIFALGLVARIFDLNIPKLERLINQRFGGKDASIVKNAMNAFNAGYSYSFGHLLETFRFAEAKKKDGQQVVMNGNEALAYGLIAAGVRFGAAYPITPWSDIMELLRRELPKYGGTFVQCEDEIASISMAIGAGWAGRVAVTGSSGPGISLKTEALGWAIMAEVPVIVVDVQRGGPSAPSSPPGSAGTLTGASARPASRAAAGFGGVQAGAPTVTTRTSSRSLRARNAAMQRSCHAGRQDPATATVTLSIASAHSLRPRRLLPARCLQTIALAANLSAGPRSDAAADCPRKA